MSTFARGDTLYMQSTSSFSEMLNAQIKKQHQGMAYLKQASFFKLSELISQISKMQQLINQFI
jgi:hypothetical protein